MSRFLIAVSAILVGVGLIIASVPAESLAQGTAAPPVVIGACPPGQHAAGKTCVKDEKVKASDFAPKQCPAGQHAAGKTCVKDIKASDFAPGCPPNHRLVNGKCTKIVIHIAKQCPPGEHLAGQRPAYCVKN